MATGSKRPLIVGILFLTCVISGVLYLKLVQMRKSSEDKFKGSLEFASIQNGASFESTISMDYEQRLKKSDLFISDFVPTEYTQYVAPLPIPIHKKYFGKQVQKRALLGKSNTRSFAPLKSSQILLINANFENYLKCFAFSQF